MKIDLKKPKKLTKFLKEELIRKFFYLICMFFNWN